MLVSPIFRCGALKLSPPHFPWNDFLTILACHNTEQEFSCHCGSNKLTFMNNLKMRNKCFESGATMHPMQMRPHATASPDSKERGYVMRTGDVDAHEHGFQAQAGARGRRRGQVCVKGDWTWRTAFCLCLQVQVHLLGVFST